MTNQEMARILNGTMDEKIVLFRELIQKAVDSQLSDAEIIILETLKIMLIGTI